MHFTQKVRSYLTAGAALVLSSACAMQTNLPITHAAGAVHSWMTPAAQSQNLLYVSDLGTNEVDVLSYPSGSPVGKLSGFGSVAGLCVDKAGDVFVVDEAGPVQVFAHGGTTPIRKLTVYGAPYGCSADSLTGNLAVTNLSSYLYGAVAIYPKAKGAPNVIKSSEANSTYFCGYDPSGNLYVDGNDHSAAFVLWELPKGKTTLSDLHFTKQITKPGGVQWDGSYVAVGDYAAGLIYRTKRGSGVVAKTVTLKSGDDVQQFWIAGGTLVGQSLGEVPYWHYPGGGSPSKTLLGFSEPIAATVSVAKAQ